MKYLMMLLLVTGLCTATVYEANAQRKSKKERKTWKKKMKQMDPLKFKEMYEEVNSLKAESAALKKNIGSLETQLRNQESLTASKDEEIGNLQQKVAQLQADCGENVTASGDDYSKGVVFKVQIGAFRNKDLSQFQDKGNFWTEDEDGVKKYTIGYFRDYWEADTFKKYLREMGVKDAWIVAYEDNQRKDIKDVLESTETGLE